MKRKVALVAVMSLVVLVAFAFGIYAQVGEREQVSLSQTDTSMFPKVRLFLDVPKEMMGVSAEDVVIEENGERQKVERFGPGEGGLQALTNVVLAIDTSSSMDDAIDEARRAALGFVGSIDPFDRVAIVQFHTDVSTVTEPTSDKDSLSEALRKLKPQRTTAIYDAIAHSVQLLSEQVERRAVVLMTDGMDVASEATLEEAIRAAKDAGVPVYVIGLRTRVLDPELLRRIAKETGGKYLEAAKPHHLAGVYETIAGGLQAQYELVYRTSNVDPDGTQRKLELRIGDQRLTARYRAPTYAEWQEQQEKLVGGRIEVAREMIERGKVDESLKGLAEVLKIDPKNPRAHLLTAQGLVLRGKVTEGLAELELGLEYAGDDPGLMLEGAKLYATAGKTEKADEMLDLVLDMEGLRPEHRIAAGRQLLARGRADEAIEALEFVVEEFPGEVEAHVYLAKAYDKVGRTRDAVDQIDRVLQLEPDNVLAQSMRTEWAKRPAVLNLASDPAEATVHVNGYLKGRTPCDVTVESVGHEPRAYDVVVRADGYVPVYRRIELVQGDEQHLGLHLQSSEALETTVRDSVDDVWREEWGHQREYSVHVLVNRGVMVDVNSNDHLEFVVEVQLIPSRQLWNSRSMAGKRHPFLLAVVSLDEKPPGLEGLWCIGENTCPGLFAPAARDVDHDGISEVLISTNWLWRASTEGEYLLLDLSGPVPRVLLRCTSASDGQFPQGPAAPKEYRPDLGVGINTIHWLKAEPYDKAVVSSAYAQVEYVTEEKRERIVDSVRQLGRAGVLEWSDREQQYVGELTWPE